MSNFDPFSPDDSTFQFGKESTRNRGSPLKGRSKIPHVRLSGVEHKSCAECGSLKPLDQFSKDGTRIDGLRSYCLICDLERKERKRRENKEEAKREFDTRDRDHPRS